MKSGRAIAPPEGLDSDSRKLWFTTQRALKRQLTWQDTDAPLLERYVRAAQRARDARKAAQRTPYVKGSAGQLTAHPGMRLAREAEKDQHEYAAALILTPEARKRHGIEPPIESELDALLAG